MRKRCVFIVLCMILTLAGPASAGTQASITENTGMLVNINGSLVKFKSVPLMVNKECFLPADELLTGMGIKNDKQHLILDSKKKTIKITNSGKEISMTADSKTAYVNKVKKTLNNAPVIYKNKVYVPAVFVAQGLGMQAYLDTSCSMLLVRDTAGFNKMKDTLAKVTKAMDACTKYRTDDRMKTVLSMQGTNVVSERAITTEIDLSKKILHSLMKSAKTVNGTKNGSFQIETVLKDNAFFIRESSSEWTKADAPSKQAYNNEFLFNEILPNNGTYAGLKNGKPLGKGEILLQGNVFPNRILSDAFGVEGFEQYSLDGVYTELTIDSSTYRLKKIYVKASGSTKLNNISMKFTLEMQSSYSQYNGQFQVNTDNG